MQAEGEGIVWAIGAFPAAVVHAVPAALAAAPAATAGAAQGAAAREVLRAWAAGEAGAEAAAGGGGEEAMTKENHMMKQLWKRIGEDLFSTVMVVAMLLVLAISSQAQAQSQPAGRAFAAPKEAADALIQAASDFNVPVLLEILGPDGKDLVASGDQVLDKNRAVAFAAKAREKLQLIKDPKNPDRVTLTVGDQDWPLPMPIIMQNGKWYYDSKAGLDELLRRRIGENELDAITVLRGYDDAQLDYASEIHDNSGVNQYAQKIISTPGKQDGLAWQNADGSWGGPVGEVAAKALMDGYGGKGQPYHGYFYKVLKGQGPAARLGTLDYVIEGAMIGGFALVAWPSDYRVTGVQTFIVSYDGVVYQKDLGPDTAKIASAMERYNPDKTWDSTDDNW